MFDRSIPWFSHSSIPKCNVFHHSSLFIAKFPWFSPCFTAKCPWLPPFLGFSRIATSGRSSARPGPASQARPWRRTGWSRRGWRRSPDPLGCVPRVGWTWEWTPYIGSLKGGKQRYMVIEKYEWWQKLWMWGKNIYSETMGFNHEKSWNIANLAIRNGETSGRSSRTIGI